MAKLKKEQKEEMELVWENIKTGVAVNQHWKSRMFALYNEIHKTNYKGNTNCSSCMGSVYSYFKSKMIKPKKEKNDKK
jgi:hypothetical protein